MCSNTYTRQQSQSEVILAQAIDMLSLHGSLIIHSRVAGYRFLPICLNSMTHGYIIYLWKEPVLSQGNVRSCTCVLGISILSISTIFLLNVGTVQTVQFVFKFYLFK
jgi:hypothetical protein